MAYSSTNRSEISSSDAPAWPLHNSLIFDFFRALPAFSRSAFFDRGDFDAGDEGLFGVDLSVARIQGASAGQAAFADELDQGTQPPAGERHVMGGEKQVQAIFRRVALVLALRHAFQRIAHQLRIREAVETVVLSLELDEAAVVIKGSVLDNGILGGVPPVW